MGILNEDQWQSQLDGLLIIFIALNLSILIAVLLWLRQLRNNLLQASHLDNSRLEAETIAASQLQAAKQQMPRANRFISIEILNPVQLASEQSRIAGPLATVSPETIHKLVYDKVCETLREELTAKGVEADIQVRHVK